MKKKRQNKKKLKIRITKWHRKAGVKPGKILMSNKDIKVHEKKTVEHLVSFGYDIEVLAPSNMPGTNNPDLLMMGTFWEMKGPVGNNENTLKRRFHKAIKQSEGKSIFDLRNIRKLEDAIEVEARIMKFFRAVRGMRRIIIIRKNEETLDIMK